MRVGLIDISRDVRCRLEIILRRTRTGTKIIPLESADELPYRDALQLIVTGDHEIPSIAKLARHAPVVVMSDGEGLDHLISVMRAGACGHVTWQASPEKIELVIKLGLQGGFATSVQPLPGAAAVSDDRNAARLALLSARERETLRHIADGLTHAQVATRMGISKATVETYVSRVRTKLRVGNKAELAMVVFESRRPF